MTGSLQGALNTHPSGIRFQSERFSDFVPVAILQHHVDGDRILFAKQRSDACENLSPQQDLTRCGLAIGDRKVVNGSTFVASKITTLAAPVCETCRALDCRSRVAGTPARRPA